MTLMSRTPHENRRERTRLRPTWAGLFASGLVAATMVVLAPATAHAADIIHDGIEYEINSDDEAIAIGLDDPSQTDLVFPASIDDGGDTYPVTRVAEHSFEDETLDSVVFEGDIWVGFWAFAETGLTSVTFHGEASVGNVAFAHNEITSLEFHDTVPWLGSSAFADNNLTSLSIDQDVNGIGSFAFQNNDIESVSFGGDVGNITHQVFQGNSNLTTATFGGTVGEISGSVFRLTDLTEAWFHGPPPTSIVGANESSPSLGTAEGLTVYYTCAFDEDVYPGGFTSPVWEGYDAQGSSGHTVSFDTGPGGSVPAQELDCTGLVNEPEPQSAEGWLFTGWYLNADTTEPFDFDIPVATDMTVYAGWESAEITELVLEASATEVDEGGQVTITATGLNEHGTQVGDVTDDITLVSDVDTDVIEANTVTFPTASEHVITATYGDGVTADITITVIAADAAVNGLGGPGEDQAPVAGVLPATGAALGPWALTAGMLMVGLGSLALWMRRRLI